MVMIHRADETCPKRIAAIEENMQRDKTYSTCTAHTHSQQKIVKHPAKSTDDNGYGSS